MKGRKPKSLEELQRDGTFRKDRHGHLTQPRGAGLPPLSSEPPDVLTGSARDEWVRLHSILTTAGILTAGERALFIVFCHAYGVYMDAIAKANEGEYFERDADGNETDRVNKWYRLGAQASGQMKDTAKLLALNPSDRGRVALPKPAPPVPKPRPGGRSSPGILPNPFSLKDD